MRIRLSILAIAFISALQVSGIDVRMNPITWTFDQAEDISASSSVHNLGGIYYQGGNGCSQVTLDQSEIGVFSDGTQWSSSSFLKLTASNFNGSYLDFTRRLAGKYSKESEGVLAFNTAVSGTCYVMMNCNDDIVAEGGLLYIHAQYKELKKGWSYCSKSASTSRQVIEVSLHIASSGSFWISSTCDTRIYAVRFVPDETIPLIKTAQAPVEFIESSNGNWFADFGKAAFGQIELTLNSDNETDTVLVHLGECIKDGVVDREPGDSRRYECLKLPLKKGTHTYNPEIPHRQYSTGLSSIYMPMEIGEVMPFRYCEIEGYVHLLKSEDIKRQAVNYQFDEDASFFHCDNDTLNQVWEFCKYSIKATSFMGYYVDGDRERCPYEADALINQLCHYATDCEYTMARRTFEWLMRNPTWPTEWILQMNIIAWYDYLYSGDSSLLSKYIDQLYSHALFSFVDPDNGLLSTSLIYSDDDRCTGLFLTDNMRDIIDWPQSERDEYDFTDFNTVINAYHYEAVKCLAKMYLALNRQDDYQKMRDYSLKFKDTFNHYFLDTERGIYYDGLGSSHSSLHANMFALAFGLVPDEYRQSVANFIVSRGMSCSVYGAQFLLNALYDAGKAEDALKLMTSESDRSWINMMREGSTVSMEAWGNKFKPNQDWNHAWGAAPANIIPFQLMGIKPTEPGFSHAEIRPQIGSLRKAECKVPTRYGSINVLIQNNDKDFIMKIDAPEQIKYDVYLPLPPAGYFKLYVDDIETEKYQEDSFFIKLPSYFGIHKYKISYLDTSETVVDLLENNSNSHIIYDLMGRKIAERAIPGIYLRDGHKVIIKQ